jgi:hypothetical protein
MSEYYNELGTLSNLIYDMRLDMPSRPMMIKYAKSAKELEDRITRLENEWLPVSDVYYSNVRYTVTVSNEL